MKINLLPLILLMMIVNSCSSFLYRPMTKFAADPRTLGYSVENLYIDTSDGAGHLHAWYFSLGKKRKKGLVVKFNDAVFNMSYYLNEINWLLEDGFDILTYDYRGFGDSAGEIDQGLNYFDAHKVFDKARVLLEKDPEMALIVWGKGVGGYTALRSLMGYPKRYDIDLMVVDNSFCSARDLLYERSWQKWYTVPLSPIAYLVASDKMECLSYLHKWDVPTLFIHGDKNTNTPISLAQDMLKRMPNSLPVWFYKSHGRGHNNSVLIHRENFNKLIDGLNFSSERSHRVEKSLKLD